jgi:hypothetical protein
LLFEDPKYLWLNNYPKVPPIVLPTNGWGFGKISLFFKNVPAVHGAAFVDWQELK